MDEYKPKHRILRREYGDGTIRFMPQVLNHIAEHDSWMDVMFDDYGDARGYRTEREAQKQLDRFLQRLMARKIVHEDVLKEGGAHEQRRRRWQAVSTFAGDSIKAARILREKCGYELRPRIRKQEYAGTRKRKAPRYLPLVYLPGRKCKVCGNPIRPWNATGICNTNTFCQTTSRRIKMYVRRGGRPITPWWFYPGAIDAPRGETK